MWEMTSIMRTLMKLLFFVDLACLNACQDLDMVQEFFNTDEETIDDGISTSLQGQYDSCIKSYELFIINDKHIIELMQEVIDLEKSKESLSSPTNSP